MGKNWAEADADVGETIDFLEFYAREALRLASATTPIQYPGEHNELLYIPLGVGAVIPPWNFPFAIMAGHDGGGHRDRQHRGPQAVQRLADHRRQVS